MNPRSLSAFIRQANTIDMTRRSPSYEIRLANARHGFEVYFPDLRRDDVNQESEVCESISSIISRGCSNHLLGL